MKNIIPALGWLLFLSVPVNAAGIPDTLQWTLRFLETRSYSSALTGCYGTASYQYVTPGIEYLKKFHRALRSKAAEHQYAGFIWSSTVDSEDEQTYLALDIATGEVSSHPRGDKGYVFCLCRKTYLKNCSPSGVPPLGEPFTAYAGESP